MRFEFTKDGATVGAAQWEGPGQVTLHVADPAQRRQLAEYFAAETTYLSTGFGQDEEFQIRRRDWTPWEFERSCMALGHRMGYEVTRTAADVDERRPATASTGAPKRMATAAFASETRPASNGHAAEHAPEASA